jgi:hypothetical protein
MHQIVCDGWSLGVFMEEFVASYDAISAGVASPLLPLSIQYADFAYWQRHWPSHPEFAAQLAYWRRQLQGPMSVLKLATTRSRRAIDSFRTVQREVALPASLAEAAKRFSHREGGTMFMALVAAMKTVLHRYLGQEDLRVATNIANRNRRGTEGLIGPLANTVILRTNLGGDPSALEVLRRVRATILAAFANQDLPFDELAAVLERERGMESVELAKVMILLQSSTLRSAAISGHKLVLEEASPNMLQPLVTLTPFDIVLMLSETAHGLVGTCVYKPHLFRVTTIDRLLRHFQEALEQMISRPERPISAIRFAEESNLRIPLNA